MPTPHTITHAADCLRRGIMTVGDLVDQSLAAVDRDGVRTNAFIRLDIDTIRDRARAMDAERRRGIDRGPLHGMPISIKDLIDVRGMPTTCASRAMPDTPAAADATVVARLLDAGVVLFGKTNLHEFALGTTSDESAWGPVRHGADPTRSAGGSSGGSAVAVATGMGLASIGTDTGGSIRIPAAVCGVVGLKPTFDDVPVHGIVPLSVSLDHAGPIARTVDDATLVWRVLADRPGPPSQPLDVRGLRLGRVSGYFEDPLMPVVREAFEAAVDALQTAGARLTALAVADLESVPDTYIDIALSEAAAWHAAHITSGDSAYTPGVARRLARGRGIPATSYLAARAAQRRLQEAINGAFAAVDALVVPTLPLTAPPLHAEAIEVAPGTHGPMDVRAAMLKHTQPFNLSGHPAISIPIATSGLPVGLQIVGPHGDTARLLAIAAACERALGVG